MKISITLLLTLLPIAVLGQHLNGIVYDQQTRLPVAGANISAGTQTTFTAAGGSFNLAKVRFGDTVKVSYIGYKRYTFVKSFNEPDTLRIYIEQNSIQLGDISIKGKRNYKADSVRLRRDFASVFAYKAPTLKNIFITHSPWSSAGGANNTSQLAGIDLLLLIGLLTKKTDPVSHLQQILLKDEENNYVYQRFASQKITELTKLKGDSLKDFIYRYRPAITEIKKMNDYDLIIYIKKSYTQYLHSGKSDEISPFQSER